MSVSFGRLRAMLVPVARYWYKQPAHLESVDKGSGAWKLLTFEEFRCVFGFWVLRFAASFSEVRSRSSRVPRPCTLQFSRSFRRERAAASLAVVFWSFWLKRFPPIGARRNCYTAEATKWHYHWSTGLSFCKFYIIFCHDPLAVVAGPSLAENRPKPTKTKNIVYLRGLTDTKHRQDRRASGSHPTH
jgi:hypothetical protein